MLYCEEPANVAPVGPLTIRRRFHHHDHVYLAPPPRGISVWGEDTVPKGGGLGDTRDFSVIRAGRLPFITRGRQWAG